MQFHSPRAATGALALIAALAACTDSSTPSRVLDTSRSTVTFDPATYEASDNGTSQIMVRVVNAGGEGISGATVVVTLEGAGGTVTQPTAETGPTGIAIAHVETTRAGTWTPTIAVTIDGSTEQFAGSSTLTVTPAEPSAAHSSATVAPQSVVADGATESTITVLVRDRFDNPVPGTAVGFAIDGLDTTLGAPSGTADASGAATTTVTATRLGERTVTATVAETGGAVELADHPTLTFTPIVALDESEPNDAPNQALPVTLGTAAYGDVTTAGDVDYWAIALHEGEVVSLTIFATRLSQSGWVLNGNVPRLTVWNADGSQKIVEQDYSGNSSNASWSWDDHDLDIARFRAETTGTYLVSVTQDDTNTDGGIYGLVVEPVFAPGDLAPEGTTVTQSTTIEGFHTNDTTDLLTLTIAAPSLVSVDLWAYRNGARHAGSTIPDYYDPYLYLRTAGANPDELDNDDDSFYDSGIGAVLQAGDYEIEVDEYSGSEADAPHVAAIVVEPIGTTTAEVEPNGTFQDATPIAFGTFVSGQCIVSGDLDVFRFEATAGQILRVEVYDPMSMLPTPVLPQDVTVEILDPSQAAKGTDWGSGVPAGGTIVNQSGTHYVRLSVSNNDATDYLLRVTVESTDVEVEPNDELAGATPIQPITPASGVIDVVDDADIWSFTVAEAGQLVSFAVISEMPNQTPMSGRQGLGSTLMARLVIRDAQGAPLAVSDSNDNPYAQSILHGESGCEVAFRAPTAGTFFVEVGDSNGTASAEHYYVLRRTR